jgi:uncharacterized membrane protein HdeD (DUF308 family)
MRELIYDADTFVQGIALKVAAFWVKVTNHSSYLLAFFVAVLAGACALMQFGSLGERLPRIIIMLFWCSSLAFRCSVNDDLWRDGKSVGPWGVDGFPPIFHSALRLTCIMASLMSIVLLLITREFFTWLDASFCIVTAAEYLACVKSPPRQEKESFVAVPQAA